MSLFFIHQQNPSKLKRIPKLLMFPFQSQQGKLTNCLANSCHLLNYQQNQKSSGRVLTSSEALKLLQEKEEKKIAAKKQKELCRKKKANKSQQRLQEKHNDIKETVEESIKIKGSQGTKNNLKAYYLLQPS